MARIYRDLYDSPAVITRIRLGRRDITLLWPWEWRGQADPYYPAYTLLLRWPVTTSNLSDDPPF